MTWRFTVRSVPIDVPPLIHVEGRWTRDGFQLAEGTTADIERRYHGGDWAGCETRVRFSFPASERQFVDESKIRVLFPGALRLDLEPVAVPDRALRAPEVAAATTLPEKVDAWSRLNGGSNVPASVLQKLATLEHGDATSVLSAVANQVASVENGRAAEEGRAA